MTITLILQLCLADEPVNVFENIRLTVDSKNFLEKLPSLLDHLKEGDSSYRPYGVMKDGIYVYFYEPLMFIPEGSLVRIKGELSGLIDIFSN